MSAVNILHHPLPQQEHTLFKMSKCTLTVTFFKMLFSRLGMIGLMIIFTQTQTGTSQFSKVDIKKCLMKYCMFLHMANLTMQTDLTFMYAKHIFNGSELKIASFKCFIQESSLIHTYRLLKFEDQREKENEENS